MSFKQLTVGAALALAVVGSAQAAAFTFSGTIASHKDVIEIPFSLTTDATNVRVWTDSYMNGLNFDPITAVWNGSGVLIGQNDDNASIAPGQTRYDSGLVFSTLAAGNYLFTIATYNNFAVSSNLSDGFSFDHQAPIPLALWCEPASHCNMGPAWQVHLTGVDGAISPVPEPATYGMLIVGLGLLGFAARRRQGSK